jgi:DNA modification methylase
MPSQSSFNLSAKKSGPVECLGQTFPSEDARREHYLNLLAEKLKDPEFRKIEGFPIGEDEDILALSDPPYYTACPNPWIGDFIQHYGRPYDPKEKYHREPFAADVSEGKNHPIYNAHSYHTKVPHRAIMRYILHYTEPGDIVFDGFCGTGMTGVAANYCADRKEVHELECRIGDNGQVFDQSGKHFANLGLRHAILCDLSPAATAISSAYNSNIDLGAFEQAAQEILSSLENEFSWMYLTKHTDGKTDGEINYMIWSEINSCAECAGEFVFYEEALDSKTKKLRDEFKCPHCGSAMKKGRLDVVYESILDSKIGEVVKLPRRIPVLINYSVGSRRFEKVPDADDLALLEKVKTIPIPIDLPGNQIPDMQMMRVGRMQPSCVTHIQHFFLDRPARVLGRLWALTKSVSDRPIRGLLQFWIDSHFVNLSIRNRYRPEVSFPYNPLTGVFYVPSIVSEANPYAAYKNKLRRIVAAIGELKQTNSNLIQTCSASAMVISDNTVDYIFTDPPFGENIYYSDLNYFIESWYGVFTNCNPEAIVDRVRGKALGDYQRLMLACFKEYFRMLKPGRWITVEFSNSQASVWNAIQATMQEAGFVVANVAALDKQMRSFQSVTSPTAVKQDLVISAYKPNGGLEERFRKSGHTVEGVWDFMRTHLRNLPVVKPRGGELEFITERDPRILYDRMVAFYVGHGMPVPLSSAEFQAALAEKFPEREGMFFLPEQVTEWDKKRAQMEGVGQMSIFVEDEKSAIDWLRKHLKDRPSTYQDIQPEFMQQLGASWKKFETRPELSLLLEQNFLRYDAKGEVPSQIHSYLSTQNKDLRNLPKDDARLQSRAKDRWFVPDPAKAVDVEAVRNKRLLQEFWDLCTEAGISRPNGPSAQQTLPLITPTAGKKPGRKKLKEVRTEAVRLGFKECFAAKDYATILAIADHLPANVVEEDEQLQMMHDMAEMRAQG